MPFQGLRFLGLVIFPFRSREKTLASILEIFIISLLRYKGESLSERSQVYENLTRIIQGACTRTTHDTHRSRAQESHIVCMGHVHGNHTQCAQAMCTRHVRGQQHEERFFDFSRHVLHHKELIWEHPDPGMIIFSLDLYFIKVFETIIFCYVRSR